MLNPNNGHTICAQNQTNMWCNIECHSGYGIYSEFLDEHIENMNLICDHSNPQWNSEAIDCTLIEMPNSISELISFTVDSNEGICEQSDITTRIQNELKLQIHEQLCEDQSDCEIVSDISLCRESEENNNMIEKKTMNKNDTTFYNIVKREISIDEENKIKKSKKIKSEIKFNAYAKTLYPNRDLRKTNKTNSMERFKTKMEQFNIDLTFVARNVIAECRIGSVPKKNICGKSIY